MENTGIREAVYSAAGVLIFVAHVGLWVRAMRRCWGRSLPFSIIVATIGTFYVVSISGMFQRRAPLQFTIGAAVLYLVHVGIPAALLLRERSKRRLP